MLEGQARPALQALCMGRADLTSLRLTLIASHERKGGG